MAWHDAIADAVSALSRAPAGFAEVAVVRRLDIATERQAGGL
jgi:hypothetical protein